MEKYKTKNNIFPHIPERISRLGELAENLWWSWNPQARMLFKMLDRQAWKESGHNPDAMLKKLPQHLLQEAAQDRNYLRHYDLVMSQFDQQANHDNVEDRSPVAYFSAEYGLHHSLPFFAGGLGLLAGDHLKECSDMRLPLVAVGFMYPSGYLKQTINKDGWQESVTQTVDRESASINQIFDTSGERIIIEIPHLEPRIRAAVWKVAVGRVSLFLIDTEIEENPEWIQHIARQLYTSDQEHRLLQEAVLGLGGYTLLRRLGIDPYMIHLNEGHPAFALLEAMRDLMQQGRSFDQAKKEIREKSLFTTHTPVPAGHDVFPAELMDKYFPSYWQALGLDRESFLELGKHPEKPESGFNMTVLAMRLTGQCNAVSRRHGEVTRQMWQGLWPDKQAEDIPIDHVTNGVHLPTWLDPKIRLLYNQHFDEGWIMEHDNPAIWEFIEEIPDEKLWQTHYLLKVKLLNHIRQLARENWRQRQTPDLIPALGTMLEPSILTIGFGRRFATYKRADLILQDPERLKQLVNDSWRPIQIIFAGKAHPADHEGQRLMQRVIHFAQDPEFSGRIAFVENFNEQLAQYMVHGVDVWLNTPQPPMEASGTSGMKASINGVPNLSIPDGWWLEGASPGNGWTIPLHQDAEPGEQDWLEARELYHLIEERLIPKYYSSSETGVPHEWVRIMKEAIKTVAPHFSARRMVKEYQQKHYQKQSRHE